MIGIPRTIVKKTDLRLEFDEIKEITRELISKKALSEDNPQLCVNHRPKSKNPLYEGAGTKIYPENEFTEINEIFKDTAFERILSQIENYGRVRLMYMAPKKCYSFHCDDSERMHFAISTNSQSFLLVENNVMRAWKFHIPADSCGYIVNTRHFHTAFNGGTTPRIHLLVNLTEQPA